MMVVIKKFCWVEPMHQASQAAVDSTTPATDESRKILPMTARNIARKKPNAPHRVTHLDSFWTNFLFEMELIHPTAVMHSMMNKVGGPK
jgi:hypothetical protein